MLSYFIMELEYENLKGIMILKWVEIWWPKEENLSYDLNLSDNCENTIIQVNCETRTHNDGTIIKSKEESRRVKEWWAMQYIMDIEHY